MKMFGKLYLKAATEYQCLLTIAYLLTIAIQILSFRQPILTIKIVAHVQQQQLSIIHMVSSETRQASIRGWHSKLLV